MTLEELQVVITAQTAGLRSELGKVNTQLNSVQKQATRSADGIGKAFSKAARVIAAIGIGKIVKDSFVDAAQVNTNIENLSKMLGENSKEFMNWANGQAKSFGIAKKEAMSYGMTFANLVSGFSGGTAQTTQLTTQLLQTSSVIASKTGRSMEDVMERIRSGMLGNTEAVEDLGIYASASAMQQTQAYKTMANGTPWNQLDYYTKQQIITFGLLEQASTKYGNTMSGGLTSQMLIFRAELSNLKTSLGQAFVPIVTVILPYLMALIKHLQVAMSYVVAFVQLLFGVESAAESSQGLADTAQEASNHLGSSAGNAGLAADNLGTAAKNAKKLKGALAGFDEINTLNMDDGADASASVPSAGGSVGSGIEVPAISIPTPEVDSSGIRESVMGVVDNIKTWFGNIDFNPLIDSFNRLKESISPIVDKMGEGLKWFLDNIIKPFAEWVIEDALPAFFDLLSGALDVLNPILESFQRVGKWLWDEFLQPIAEWTGGVIVSILEELGNKLKDIGAWMTEHEAVMDNITIIIGSFAAAWGLVNLAIGIWNIVGGIAAGVTTAFGAAVAFLTSPIGLVILAIAAIIAIIVLLVKNWDWIKETAVAVWDKIVEVWKVVAGWFYENVIQPLGEFFKGLWDDIVGIFNGVKDWFSSKFTEAWEAIKNVFSTVGSFFSGIWDTIKGIFSTIGGAIGNAIGDAFKFVVNNIINFAENTINGFIWAINKAIGLINAIPGVNIGYLKELDIPRLARGGIVDSAQMFIAGEAGKEVVMPLENNTGWITDLAEKVATRMPQETSNDRPLEVTLQVGSSQLGRVVIDSINKVQSQEGKILLSI